MLFSDTDTKVGRLSPWEMCKAFAFHTALRAIEKTLQKHACAFLGERANVWIGKQLQVKGGGCLSEVAVVKAIARCQGKDSPHTRKGASEVAPNLFTPGLGTH